METKIVRSKFLKSILKRIKKISSFKKTEFLAVGILITVSLVFFYFNGVGKVEFNTEFLKREKEDNINKEEIPIEISFKWGDLGKQMIEAGVIDAQKFEEIYKNRGGLTNEDKNILGGENVGNLIITSQNSGIVLNLLWALGLGNKSKILESGPMQDPKYGGPDDFASIGGWTIAKGDTMVHYGKHPFIVLTKEQEAMVEKVSKGIYRPCCNNSTYFPDCNHGMAMLGLLELLASQGIREEEMYQIALKVNTLWFKGSYDTIKKYIELKGLVWGKADPKEILGEKYSSGSGYREILKELGPSNGENNGGCSV